MNLLDGKSIPLSKSIVDCHRKYGASIVTVLGENGWVKAKTYGLRLCDATKGKGYYTQRGSRLFEKDIRRVLFEHRTDRPLRRRSGAIWTVYDKESDTSLVGLGDLVQMPVEERFRERLQLQDVNGEADAQPAV